MRLFNLFNKEKRDAALEPETQPSVRYERLAMFKPGLSYRIEATEPWYLAKRKTTDIEVVRVTTPDDSKLVIMPKYIIKEEHKQFFDEDLDAFIKRAFNGSVPQSLDEIERLYKKYMWVSANLIRY